MTGTFFWVGAVRNPPKKDAEKAGKLSEVIVAPQLMIGKDGQAVATQFTLDNVEVLKTVPQEFREVFVIPFA